MSERKKGIKLVWHDHGFIITEQTDGTWSICNSKMALIPEFAEQFKKHAIRVGNGKVNYLPFFLILRVSRKVEISPSISAFVPDSVVFRVNTSDGVGAFFTCEHTLFKAACEKCHMRLSSMLPSTELLEQQQRGGCSCCWEKNCPYKNSQGNCSILLHQRARFDRYLACGFFEFLSEHKGRAKPKGRAVRET